MTPSDPGPTLPTALSARLMEAYEALSGWWLAPLRAGRGAAEALGGAPVDFAQWNGTGNGFQEPFLAMDAHMEALRNPAPMLSAPLAESVAAAESGVNAAVVEARMPGAIGSARGRADTLTSSPGPANSGAPTRSPFEGKSVKPARATPFPAATAEGGALPRASAAMGTVSVRAVNTVEADMGPWLARAQKAIHRWAPAPSVSTGRATNPIAAKDPVSPAAGADSPAAQAWFRGWIKDAASLGPAQAAGASERSGAAAEAGLSGALGAAGSLASPLASMPSVGGAKGADAFPAAASSRTPAWTDILEELMPRASSGAQAPQPMAAAPAKALDAIPVGSRSPKDPPGNPASVTSRLRPWEDASGPGASAPVEAPLPKGVAGTEWLDEEDDLAGKLHRLLRRQAKRRGVDLS